MKTTLSPLAARTIIADWSHDDTKQMVEQISRTVALGGNNDNRVTVALILDAVGDVYGHPSDSPYTSVRSASETQAVVRTSRPNKTVGGMIVDAASRWIASRLGGGSE